MVELIGKLWDGAVILESEVPANLTKAMVSLMGRDVTVLGANANNLEQYAMISSMFGCRICISDEDLESLLGLVKRAEELGARDVIIDPMMRNMKQCLETCTDLKRLSEKMPEADHPVAVRTWSGEYAMTMASVSLLITDTVIITDDLDEDCCETLGALVDTMR
jgi:CO dehydrogenase/acetyl-CoA synthase gamma subunit (corrinoid Fe-S protein)